MASYVSTFTGDGTEVEFTAGFPVLRLTDLAVVVDNVWLTLGTDYSVSGSTATPLATLAVAPGVGAVVTLRSAVGYTPTDPAAVTTTAPTLNNTDTALWQAIGEQMGISAERLAALRIEFAAGEGGFDNSGIVMATAHGAVGDGTTDDTAAIQSALDVGASRIMLSAGATYLVSAAGTVAVNSHYGSDLTSYCLQIPSGVFLDLNGATLKLADGENAAILINANPTASYGYAAGAGYVDSDLGAGNGWLDGNQANQTYTAALNTGTMPCIYLAGVLRPRAVGLKVKNSRDFAGRFVNCDDGFFDALEAHDCAADGWSFGTSGDAPLELRGSQVGSVSADGCEAQAGWASSPQGNGAIFTAEECQVGQVIAKNCAGGIKIQNTSRDSAFGSLTFIGGTNGTDNSGVKVQGSTSLGVMPDRISIGNVTSVGSTGPGLYLHEADRVSVTSYQGEGCGTSNNYPEVWIDSVHATIGSISSLDSATTAAVVALRAFYGTKMVQIGRITARNPASKALALGASILADINYVAALSDAHAGEPYEAVGYNSADSQVSIGDIYATEQNRYAVNVTPVLPGYFLLRADNGTFPSLVATAASGQNALTTANGARLKLGTGSNAYLVSASGSNMGSPADFYAGSYGPWSAGLVSLRGTGVEIGAGGPNILGGTVDPSAGAGVAAPQGSIYLRTNGGASTTLYVKTGSAATAWTAK